ncbi:hypothetical protein MetexDRAFT_4368 [Methylorubrum extorquens DSM 13060]|uniref:Uncharacterized protein n=1 Tax=Methylorubrum extorquens DSM 13060 TaxID=882800 RepID=H1KP05_METEX|nr:hypothetical protein MetexDRAFT_4368 [Methylorubrum extorquens DSM 13060]
MTIAKPDGVEFIDGRALPAPEWMLCPCFRSNSKRQAETACFHEPKGHPMKLRVAGLVAAALVLFPGAASAQWYEHGLRHHH